MFITYLLLGSNLGDSRKYLHDASARIEKKVGIITLKSSLYQTASWGNQDQPDFINQVVRVETDLFPKELLRSILEIEVELGRERVSKWGSRTIDIDILFYDDQVLNEPDLTIPHPYLHERRFSLMPLHEIAPHLIHPTLNKSVRELLDELSDNLFVKKLY
ncbi:MAG: 2-amino-4-hydroxy-6-hydroxymethyldihydropteridine diphosphokinase [Daejeonella sp.]